MKTEIGECLYTVGQVADQLKEPVPRVSYVISKYRIKPVDRVGIIRLFGENEFQRIKKGLYHIQLRGRVSV